MLLEIMTTVNTVNVEAHKYFNGIPTVPVNDAWGNQLYYHTFKTDRSTSYIVGSNGLDGIYNNEDDIYRTKLVINFNKPITPPRYASPDGN
jgi:hypothetical protein